MKLNSNKKERIMGITFMIIWLLVLIFYMTWDGWVWEWRECGYAGPNQHFDFDFTDMKYTLVDGNIIYQSTNNLFNIIYLCYFTFFLGWAGLLFDNEKLKQGCMGTLAFPVIAALSTLQPWEHHVYIVQIVYDIVHLSGIILGVFCFYRNKLELKKTLPAVTFTWIIYLISRIVATPWPYWENDGLAFFSVNQINDMPFYLYGLEYGAVLLIFIAINAIFEKVGQKVENKHVRALIPFILFVIICVTFLGVGLIQVSIISTGTCP